MHGKWLEGKVRKYLQQYDAEPLYLVVVGSRMKQLHSEESDFDVKCVYLKPLESYLTLSDKRKDNLSQVTFEGYGEEYNVDFMDVSKFLHMVKKSNLTAFEMLSTNFVICAHMLLPLWQYSEQYFGAKELFYQSSRQSFNLLKRYYGENAGPDKTKTLAASVYAMLQAKFFEAGHPSLYSCEWEVLLRCVDMGRKPQVKSLFNAKKNGEYSPYDTDFCTYLDAVTVSFKDVDTTELSVVDKKAKLDQLFFDVVTHKALVFDY